MNMVADLAKKTGAAYQVPTILEAGTCMLADMLTYTRFNKTYTRFNKVFPKGLFYTYTRCQESIQGFQVVVGRGIDHGGCGLDIDISFCELDFYCHRVAAIVKL